MGFRPLASYRRVDLDTKQHQIKLIYFSFLFETFYHRTKNFILCTHLVMSTLNSVNTGTINDYNML